MYKIILTIIFISIPAFATDAIYAWGYGEDIKNILSSIKFFTGNATYLIDAAVVVGILMVIYKETQEDNTQKIVKVIGMAIVVSQLFFHSTNDYMVEDEVTNQAWTITDVPVGIGELFSIFTSTERVLTLAFESAFSTPNSLDYSEVGLGFSMSAHLATNNAMFIDGYAHETFMDYTTNCIASGMLDGQIDKNLIASEDIVGNIRVEGFETIVYKTDGSSEELSCQDSYDNYIKQYFEDESNAYIANRLAAQMSLEIDAVKNGLQDTSTMFFGITKSGKEYVMQQMGKNMMKKGLSVMAMTTGGDTQALAYSSAVSSSTMENQWQQAGIMAQTTLPMIKAYLTSIVLAMTPLLALLSIMFGDWKHIKMVITLLITLMLFSPLATIINYLMYLKLEGIIPTMAQGLWMPMLAMRDINSQVYSYLNFLGYAAMSIPLLAYSLVKASEQGFVNFMSGMGGSISGAANAGAGQKVNGANIGNTRVGGGSYTGANGVSTDMGGGSKSTSGIGQDNYGGFDFKENTSVNGQTNSTMNNPVANATLSNGKIESVGMNNVSAEISNADTSAYNQAKATETSTLKSLSETLSTGISQSMANGQIYTDSDDFSTNTGMSASDSRAIVKSQNEAITESLNKKLAESQSSGTTADSGFKLGGHAGWGTQNTAIGAITGVKAGVDGNFHISGTSTDGKNFSVDMSKDEMANIQKSVSDNLSKTFSEDDGLALRTSNSLADNEVFSNTELKSDMDAYTKAHSVADKYSESYSATNSTSANIGQKVLPQVVEKFIENDEILSRYYNNGDSESSRVAVSDATHRIDEAFKNGRGTDYNALNDAYKEITAKDLSGNLAQTVNQNINDGKSLETNIENTVGDGKTNIDNSKVENIIDHNPIKDYIQESIIMKEESAADMNKHKKDVALDTEKYIDKGGDIINDRRDDFKEQSRSGKALESTASGIGDIGTGLQNLNKLTSHDGIGGMEHDYKIDNNFIDKTYDKAQDSGFISNNFISDDKIRNSSKFDDFSTKELYALYDNDKNSFHLNEPSRNMVKDEILSRETSTGNNTNISNNSTELADVKNQLSYLKDDIEDSQYQVPIPIETKIKKGV